MDLNEIKSNGELATTISEPIDGGYVTNEVKPSAITDEEYANLVNLQNQQVRIKATGYEVLEFRANVDDEIVRLEAEIERLKDEREKANAARAQFADSLKTTTEEYVKAFSDIAEVFGYDPNKIAISPTSPHLVTLIPDAPAEA